MENKVISQKELLLTTNHKYRSHISRTLNELIREGVINCKNPDEKQFKLYELSKKGELLKEEIETYSKSK